MIVHGIDTHDATFEYSTDKLHLLESILGKSNYDDQLLKLLKYSKDDFKVLNVLKDRGFIDKYNIEYILNAKFSEHEIDLLWGISKLNYKVLESELGEKFDTFISMLYISMLNNSNNSNLGIFGGRDGVPYEIGVLPHDSEQKYVLSMEIEDGVGVKFCLSTHPDIKYHSELQKCETVDGGGQRCGKIFGGGSLLRNSDTKKIYVFGYSVRFGRINPVLYSVISQILGKTYQGYDIIFGKPPKNDIC